MTETFAVRHPAWVNRRKPGGRVAADALVRHETVATIGGRDPGEFRTVLDFRETDACSAGRKLYADRDGFWELLVDRDGEPVRTDDLRAYLRDDPIPDGLAHAMGRYFAGTPVAAHAGAGAWVGQRWTSDTSRGLPEPPDRIGEVFADGRARAGADLQGFLDGNVALVRHGVALRCRPVAVSRSLRPGAQLWRLSTRRRPHGWAEIAAGPHNFGALERMRPGADPEQREIIARWAEACRAMPDPEADLAHMLNVHASPVWSRLSNRLAKGGLPDEEEATVRAMVAEIAPIAKMAQLGLAGREDLAGDLTSLARGAECAARFTAFARDGSSPGHLAGFLRDHVGPRVRAMLDDAMSQEDLPAIGGLAR